MPAYGATGWPKALYPGDVIQLITAADSTAGNVTNSVPVAIAPTADGMGRNVTIINRTNQQATMQIADADATANYENAGSFTVPSNSTLNYNTVGPFLRANFASAPTTGVLSIAG